MQISVVIPTLREASRLPRLLDALRWMPVREVIVVDAGSDDGTAEIAARAGATVISGAARGRGRQLAAGARAARGDVLWFLHADAVPPPDAVAAIRRALSAPGVVGGAFRLHTVDEGDGLPLGAIARLADVRSRYTRVPYGDQGLFCRTSAYLAAGGFPEVSLFEDVALAVALRRVGRLVTVPQEVTVSGRRFTRRPLYYATLMNVLPWLWRAGVPPDTLARWYRDER